MSHAISPAPPNSFAGLTAASQPAEASPGQAAILRLRLTNLLKRKARFIPFFRSRAYMPFLLLAYPRSGSTWVHTALNSHPHILSVGEELAAEYGKPDGLQNLTYYFQRPHSKQVKALGSKLFYEQAYTETGLAFWKYWREQQLPVLHLLRRNILRVAVSEELARTHREWSAVKGANLPDARAKAIAILPEVLLQRMGHIEHLQHVFTTQLKEYPAALTIWYEDLLEQPEEQFKAIQLFLGLEPQALFSFLRRQNPEPLQQLVLNYAEIQQELQGSKWEHFLEQA
jgi:hypothetical protein